MPLNAYIAAVAALAVAGGASAWAFEPVQTEPAGRLAILVGFMLLSEAFIIRFPWRTDIVEVSLSTTFGFVIMLEFGIPVAIAIQAIVWGLGDIRARKPVHKIVFNMSQVAVSMLAAGYLTEWAGDVSLGDFPHVFGARLVGAVMLGMLGFLTVNQLLNTSVRVLATDRSWREILVERMSLEPIVDLASLSIAPLIHILLDENPFLSLVLLLPLGALLQALRVGARNVSLSLERERALVEKFEMEEQLLRSQKLDAIGQLARGITHDFNNVLAVIRNYATLAKEESKDPGVSADLDEIVKASDRGVQLLRQLMAFSRAEPSRSEPVDLPELVEGVFGLLRGTLPSAITLDLELDPVPPIRADPSQIEQVLLNLVVNARDAINGGGRIVIRTTELTFAGANGAGKMSQAVLVVADDGAGMPSDVVDKVFEPFFTTKPRDTGTGLGLAVVSRIVDQAGGDIEITSAEGEGTEVAVVLPGIASE